MLEGEEYISLDPSNPQRRGLFSLVVLLLLVILFASVLYIVIATMTRNIQTATKPTGGEPYTNPFAASEPTPTVYQNPFVTPTPTYTNPFSTLQGEKSQPYENPFEKLR